ncbi:MAG: heavy-metal-associated domain-containing protein [Candidatus Tectomicrobia bacterium]|nr:heavy-metal-associated domain-containing protein [Candidatus Tectomicrobia bacterium]
MATAVLGIEGMTCEHCVKRVTEGLASVTGAGTIKVSLERKQAQVTYDKAETLQHLKAKVVELGYKLVSG